MSLRLMAFVWDHFPGSGSQLLVMLKLADFANDAGSNIYPSMSTMARYVRLTEKQTRRIIHELIDSNWLSVVGNVNGGSHTQTRQYQMNVERLTPPPDGSRTPPKEGSREGLTPPAHGRPPLPPVSLTPPAHGSQSIKNQKIKHICRQPEGVVTSLPSGIPPCPVDKIVEIYHEVLPELPPVRMMTDQRRKHLQARWREEPRRQNLDWWRKYFQAIRTSDFLMGKTERPFRKGLEWFVKPENLAKVIEGNYANRQGGSGR